MTERLKAVAIGVSFGAALALCYGIYSSGFTGAFMFDDFPNLEPLGHWGAIDSFEKLVNFLSSGFSGPTGRPVALASFLIDANTWPAAPYSFKRTNVLFHLALGCAVFLFVIRFVQNLEHHRLLKPRVYLACLFVTLLWLFHPFWVSTTLYVIQRMAILSALFSVFSLWFYLSARLRVFQNQSLSAYSLLSLIFAALFFVLAVYSKENAIILPLCVLVIEGSLYRFAPIRSWPWKWLVILGCLIPSVIVIGYLIQRGIAGWDVADARRDFNARDRLLAQGTILWEYLRNIVIPQPFTAGLYRQVEVPSSSYERLLGVGGWFLFVCLLVVTWKLRSRWPLLFPGIALFLVAHLVESTVIPLELYFEHRSYFPAVFLTLIPLQIGLSRPISKSLIWPMSILIFLMLATLLWMRVGLWSSYDSLVISWAERAPQSIRAQLEASKIALQERDDQSALRYYERARAAEPENPQSDLWGVFVRCATSGEITAEYSERLKHRLSVAADSGVLLQYLTVIVEEATQLNCSGVTPTRTAQWLAAYYDSPRTGRKTDARLQLLMGVNALNDRNPQDAVIHFRNGMLGLRTVNAGLLAVSFLASASYSEVALRFLNEVDAAFQKGVLRGDDVDYRYEIERLRETLDRESVQRSHTR